MVTKDKKKQKIGISVPGRLGREFLGRWDKNSSTVRMHKFHTSGVCLREDKNSWAKTGQYFEFSASTSLGCLPLE